MHVWKKTVAPERIEAWIEGLRSHIDPERLAIVERPGGRRPRLEVYCDRQREADALAAALGGTVAKVLAESWQPPPATAPGKPLSIGGRLFVTSRSSELEDLRANYPDCAVLCIPAAMAFGTGEHATTAMCLRLLLEVSRTAELPSPWSVLDLGTGSGILALAGRMFGAKGADGWDNDPHAVRTARENAVLNGIKGVRFKRVDLLRGWRPAPGAWPVITANLFSQLHLALLPQMAHAIAPGGYVIMSGILATQAAEIEEALRRCNLEMVTRRRRGRWIAFLCQKRVG